MRAIRFVDSTRLVIMTVVLWEGTGDGRAFSTTALRAFDLWPVKTGRGASSFLCPLHNLAPLKMVCAHGGAG